MQTLLFLGFTALFAATFASLISDGSLIKRFLGCWVGTFIIGWLAVGFCMLFAASTPRQAATAQQASAHLGITSGKTYPVEVGRNIDGSIGHGSASAHGGLFSSSAVVSLDIQPGSAVTLGFSRHNADGTTSPSIITIPWRNIVLKTDVTPNASATAMFRLKNKQVPEYGTTESCHLGFSGIVPTYTCKKTGFTPSVSFKNNQTLQMVVEDNITKVYIDLPDSTYRKLLGKP